jgi:hypothetical protein
VSDIFNEVDEELRRERLKRIWDRYGILIILLAVLFVAGIGGWRGYQWWEAKKSAEAGAQFDAAALLNEQGQHKEAEAAFAKIAADGSGSYRVLAKMREAALLAQQGDVKGAVANYDAIAAVHSLDQMQRELAAVRSGMVLLDTASYDDLKTRLEPLTAADRTFRHSARAVLALSAWRANNTDEMKRWIDMVLADPQTPSNTRGQIEILIALAGGAGKS